MGANESSRGEAVSSKGIHGRNVTSGGCRENMRRSRSRAALICVHLLLDDADGIDFPAARHVCAAIGARRNDAVFTLAHAGVEGELIEPWSELLGLELDQVASPDS